MTQAVQASPLVYNINGMRFEENGSSLYVEIETRDLLLRSVQKKDLKHYQALYTHPETMEKFTDNELRLTEKGLEAWQREQLESVAKRIDLWVKRWEEENDPFSAFAIIKKATGEFVGHIVAGHGDKPGQSELAIIIHATEWHKGYGTQAVSAIVEQYLPALVECGFLLEKEPLSELVATARLDNVYSFRILERRGMKRVEENEKWGFKRAVYSYTYSKA